MLYTYTIDEVRGEYKYLHNCNWDSISLWDKYCHMRAMFAV